MQKIDGMNYAPVFQGKTEKVCKPGEFIFSVIGLDHGHIYAMCNGLIEAGATLKNVYDKDKKKIADFVKKYSQAVEVACEDEIFDDSDIKMIASAIIPCDRSKLGIKAMEKGKDFFSDKPGMLDLSEIEQVKQVCAKTNKKYMIYFGERIHVEGSIFAEELIKNGTIGKVIEVTILAPHRLNASTRPDWFFDKKRNGGIISDIGSHQIEQFLAYTGAKTAKVTHSFVHNYQDKNNHDFYDYGEGNLLADNGATCYFQVHWYTPLGLGAWGDGRVFILGTKGTIEIRKYIDVARDTRGDQVYWVDEKAEHYENVTGKMGFVFFGKLILDCLNRTENAMTQEHVLEAMKVAVMAENMAEEK